MQTRTKIIAAATAATVVAGLAFAGQSVAQRAHGGGMGMLRGLGAEQVMREVDTDRDGRITQAEIDAAVNARFARFDADSNGRLSLDEFGALWADITRPAAVRAFQFMDPDGDSAITKAEVDERFGRLVQRFDRDGDGALSPQDRGPRDRGPHDRGPHDRGQQGR